MTARTTWNVLSATAARAGASVVMLLGLSVVAFLLPQLTGVDQARAVIRARTAEASPDQATVDRLAQTLGLDRALPVRYLDFVGHLLTGDLGLSFTSATPVSGLLGPALATSLQLVGLALLLAIVVGLAAGTLSALRTGRAVDHTVVGLSRLASAVPEFVVAPLVVLVFAVHLRWVAATGWGTFSQAVLPVVVTAAFPAALIALLVRHELLGVLAQPWVRAARAKGMPTRRIVRQALRSSTGSVVAVATLFLPGLLGGAVIVEVVFAVPGLGRLLYTAITASDIPVTQAGLLTIMVVAVGFSLVGDLVRAVLDPRLRRRVAA